MYGLPVMETRSQSAGPSGSSPDRGMPPPPPPPPPPGAGASQGTVTLITKQWATTQAMITRVRTLEATMTQLNASQPQPHGNLLRSNLKPKMPDVYTGKSHKELHEFLRQCIEHFEALNCKVNNPASSVSPLLFSVETRLALCGPTRSSTEQPERRQAARRELKLSSLFGGPIDRAPISYSME